MNVRKIPFANLGEEMEALQKCSEEYRGRIAALKVVGREIHQEEIKKLSNLDNHCQSAIAFCFARRQPAI